MSHEHERCIYVLVINNTVKNKNTPQLLCQNEIRRVAKGCSEGWQMVSASRGGSRVVHAELVMKRRGAKPLSDAQRLRQRHPPSASLSSRGQEEGGGGLEDPRSTVHRLVSWIGSASAQQGTDSVKQSKTDERICSVQYEPPSAFSVCPGGQHHTQRARAGIMHDDARRYSGDHPPIQRVTSAITGEIIASPVRKHRRQSLPARLSAPRAEQHGGAERVEQHAGVSAAPAAGRTKVVEEPPSPPPLNHLTNGQRAVYSRVMKVICCPTQVETP